jgi:hypothetical protein
MRVKKMSLREWIYKMGPEVVAGKLNVNITTVGHWCTGHVLPRSVQMHKILELSKGLVTPTDMITSHHSKKK